jgi:hypothetical protein
MKPTCEQNWTATVKNLLPTDCPVKVEKVGAPIAWLRDHMCSNPTVILFGSLPLNST